MALPIIRLQAGRHKRVQGGHPWIFSNEIVMTSALKGAENGTIVAYQAHDGSHIGVGSYNPHSLIAGRIFSRDVLVDMNEDWFVERIGKAQAVRDLLVSSPYYRLVHAEADGLPGLVIDRFGDHFCVQLNCAGMDRLWPHIFSALERTYSPKTVVLHNDSSVRKLEGLGCEVKIAKGDISSPIEVHENGLVYFADIHDGQKTGWYYDQRDNHALVARLAKGKSVLDLYTHAGGFGLLAAAGGASGVVGVDSSAPALELARRASAHNKLDKACQWVKSDVFDDLSSRIAARERFDIVIADPPPFVRSRKDIAAGARGYRKLASLCAQVTARNGLLCIASCSHNMTLEMFTAEVARGLSEVKREGRILATTFAAPDHPLHPHLPESAYLKSLLIRLD